MVVVTVVIMIQLHATEFHFKKMTTRSKNKNTNNAKEEWLHAKHFHKMKIKRTKTMQASKKKERKECAIHNVTASHIISSYVLQHYYLSGSILYTQKQCIHILSAFYILVSSIAIHFHFCLLCNRALCNTHLFFPEELSIS